MTVDYDLAIIGGSAAGRAAAANAACLKARVALVEPLPVHPIGPAFENRSLALGNLGRMVQQSHRASLLGIQPGPKAGTDSSPAFPIAWADVLRWVEGVGVQLEGHYSLAHLAAQGVDVVVGRGEFCRRPRPAFEIEGRLLRSRTYLIATALRPIIPVIDGLQVTRYLTAETIVQSTTMPKRPARLAIVGDGPLAVELAQSFCRLGSQVTLLSRSPHLLPRLEPEIGQWIQAQLEAEGIDILPQSRILEVKQQKTSKVIQVGNQLLETDELILATGQQLDLSNLNMAAVGIKHNQNRILLNAKLQTTNPRIYACGQPNGTYLSAQLARYEANVAVKNALFWPIHKVKPLNIPGTAFSDPELAWLGLTEAQAKDRYGKDVVVLQQTFQSIERAQLRGETLGCCKFIIGRDGRFLGAHLVGPEAGELIGAIALAKQRRLKIDAIATLPYPSLSLSEICRQTARQWQQQRLQGNPRLQDRLASFFHWRRSWAR